MPAVAEKTGPVLTEQNVRMYLESRLGGPIRVIALTALGRVAGTDLKGYGYDTPVRIDYERCGERHAAVLETEPYRARGEWGEPADDVACLTMNYLFFSLHRGARLDGAFEVLFARFWRRSGIRLSTSQSAGKVLGFVRAVLEHWA